MHDLLITVGDLIVRSQPGTRSERIGLFHQTFYEYLRSPQGLYRVDVEASHRAILDAIRELAPTQRMASEDAIERYSTASEAEHLWAVGDYENATAARRLRKFRIPRENLEAWRRWVERAEQTLPNDDALVLIAHHGVAYWTGEAGQPAMGRDLCAELLPKFEHAFGPNHDQTLTVRRNFAYLTDRAGDSGAARELGARLVNDRERVLGRDHRDTLLSRADLAGFTGDAGNPAEARDLLAELLL